MVGVTDRVASLLRKIVVELTECYRYNALVRYRVIKVAPADKRLHLQIVSKRSGFPDMLPISIWPGLPGGHGEPTPGAVVLVQFIEGDPGQPIVTHFARKEDGAFLPVRASLDATDLVRLGEHAGLVELGSGSETVISATGRVIRYGDSVSVPGVGVVVFGLGALPVSKVKA